MRAYLKPRRLHAWGLMYGPRADTWTCSVCGAVVVSGRGGPDGDKLAEPCPGAEAAEVLDR